MKFGAPIERQAKRRSPADNRSTQNLRRHHRSIFSVVACGGLLLVTGCSGDKTDEATADPVKEVAAVAANGDRFVVPVGQPMPTGSHVTVSGGDQRITYHFDVSGVGTFEMTADRGAPALSEIIGLDALSETTRQAIKAGQAASAGPRTLRLDRAQIDRLADGNPNDLISPRIITARGLSFTTAITGDLSRSVDRTLVASGANSDRSANRRSVTGPANGNTDTALQIAIGPGVKEGQDSVVALIASAPGSTVMVGDACGNGDDATVLGEKTLDETGEALILVDSQIRERQFVTTIPPKRSGAEVRCFPVSLEEASSSADM